MVKKTTKKKSVKKAKDEDMCCAVSNCSCKSGGACGGCFYFLGFLGAAVYYVSSTTGFWNGVVGVLKALVWPAFLVFELLKFINM